MSIYSLALQTTASVTATPAWDMKAGAANSPKVMELSILTGQAAAGTYGIGRPANDGSVAQIGGTVLQSDDPSQPAGQTTCAVQWTVAPTLPTQFLRRVYLPATLQSAIIYTWPRGLGITALKGLVTWNLAANPTPITVNLILDE